MRVLFCNGFKNNIMALIWNGFKTFVRVRARVHVCVCVGGESGFVIRNILNCLEPYLWYVLFSCVNWLQINFPTRAYSCIICIVL